MSPATAASAASGSTSTGPAITRCTATTASAGRPTPEQRLIYWDQPESTGNRGYLHLGLMGWGTIGAALRDAADDPLYTNYYRHGAVSAWHLFDRAAGLDLDATPTACPGR